MVDFLLLGIFPSKMDSFVEYVMDTSYLETTKRKRDEIQH